MTNKLDNKWITQSQKYMEPDMLKWTWSHNKFTDHMATYEEYTDGNQERFWFHFVEIIKHFPW